MSPLDSNAQPQPQSSFFRRGDVNGDGSLHITDAILIFKHVFAGDSLPCEQAASLTGSKNITALDGISLLGYLFQGDLQTSLDFHMCESADSDSSLSCRVSHESCLNTAQIFVTDIGSPSVAGEPIAKLKREIIRRVNDLPEGAEFAIIFIRDEVLQYPVTSIPAVADSQSRNEAIQFISFLHSPMEKNNCGSKALFQALDFAKNANSENVDIGLIATECFQCDPSLSPEEARAFTLEALESFRAKNESINAQVNTITLGSRLPDCSDLYRQLSANSF